MNQRQNRELIMAVSRALEGLKEKFVFVGGAVVSLYADRPIFEVRPTDDIDIAMEIVSYSERIKIESRLNEIGFSPDVDSGVACRYKMGDTIIIDIIPTNDPSIGFRSRWYPEGFSNSIKYEDEELRINIFPAPYFIGTKLEAFKDRGNNDGRTSQDFEDIVFILENRSTIWDEINISDKNIKSYLIDEIKKLLTISDIFEWIDCHVERFSPPATYEIIQHMNNLTK